MASKQNGIDFQVKMSEMKSLEYQHLKVQGRGKMMTREKVWDWLDALLDSSQWH